MTPHALPRHALSAKLIPVLAGVVASGHLAVGLLVNLLFFVKG